MCGIVGVIGSMDMDSRALFKNLLYADVVRGPHSTGMISLTKKEILIHKKAMAASDFLELSQVDKGITDADLALIGHNRYATMGEKNAANAHPFMHGDISLVHNGTVTNKYELHNTRFDTDSETIAKGISDCSEDEIVPYLEKIEGAYVLVWIDSTGDVRIAKNEERPLHYFVVQKHKKKFVVLASEKLMGEWLLSRTAFEIVESHPVPVGKLITLDPESLEYTTKEFTPKVKKVHTYGQGFGNGSQRGFSSSYVYPHNATPVYFTITDVFGARATGISRCGKEVEVYPSQQQVEFEVGGAYIGTVHSIQNNRKMFLRPRSTRIDNSFKGLAEDNKVLGPCGFCDTDVTKYEITSGGAFKYGDCYIHLDCSETMDKGVQQ